MVTSMGTPGAAILHRGDGVWAMRVAVRVGVTPALVGVRSGVEV